jgi:hypothetical protein
MSDGDELLEQAMRERLTPAEFEAWQKRKADCRAMPGRGDPILELMKLPGARVQISGKVRW